MSDDYDEIWLEPDCCADYANVGRMWADGDVFDNCEHDAHSTRYVRSDIAEKRDTDAETYRKALNEIIWWGEQHTDSAVGRRLTDFRNAIKVAVKALDH